MGCHPFDLSALIFMYKKPYYLPCANLFKLKCRFLFEYFPLSIKKMFVQKMNLRLF